MSGRSSSSPEPLNVEVSSSAILRAALIVLALLVLFALAQAALSPWWRAASSAVVLFYLLYGLRGHTGLCGALACTALRWDGAVWWWRGGDGDEPVSLRRATLWPGFILLEFRTEHRGSTRMFSVSTLLARTRSRRVLLLLPDSASAHALRRLRVHLRHLPVFTG